MFKSLKFKVDRLHGNAQCSLWDGFDGCTQCSDHQWKLKSNFFFMHYFENLSSNTCSLLLLTCSILRAKYENVSLAYRTFFTLFHIFISNRMLWKSRESCPISVIVNEGDVNKDHLQLFDCFFVLFCFWFVFYLIEPFWPTWRFHSVLQQLYVQSYLLLLWTFYLFITNNFKI